ncbi:hypothetical protein BT93_D0809 [Corymbia citriodora subsp. variegata]|nr:hypothetical protein BT93_D0809 [Corymbia citriodora subsp. variegata]
MSTNNPLLAFPASLSYAANDVSLSLPLPLSPPVPPPPPRHRHQRQGPRRRLFLPCWRPKRGHALQVPNPGQDLVPRAGFFRHVRWRRLPVLAEVERGVPVEGDAFRRRFFTRDGDDAIPHGRYQDVRCPNREGVLLHVHALLLDFRALDLRQLAHHARPLRYLLRLRQEGGGTGQSLQWRIGGLRGIVQGKDSSANGETHHHNWSVAVGSPSDSILLTMALCFHSVFLGIATGVAETKPDAWKTTRTIFPHSIFAAIAMGIVLTRRMPPNRPLLPRVAYAFAFAISSPISVVIGIVIDPTTWCAVAGWSSAIFSGFCGVFIYVSVISNRYVQSADSLGAFLASMLGFGIIVVLMIWDAFGYSAAVYLFGRKEIRTPWSGLQILD